MVVWLKAPSEPRSSPAFTTTVLRLGTLRVLLLSFVFLSVKSYVK